jgi:hypothetical protein
MAHRHADEYQHRHDHEAEPHVHRLLEVIEHAHGAHGAQRHSHTHIIMTTPAEPTGDKRHHQHRLQAPFEHDHPSANAGHRHPLGDIEHHEPDRHWHEIEIIELVIERPSDRRA